MNPIRLSHKQSERLLEMCKALFPEYKEIYWNSGKGSNGSSEHLGFGTQEKDNLQFMEFIFIHWFEFCMTKLINELAFQNISSDLFGDCEFEEFRMKCINEIFKDKPSNEIIHPIDYLYEQFKQLKLTK